MYVWGVLMGIPQLNALLHVVHSELHRFEGNTLVLAGTAMSADLSCPRNPEDTAAELHRAMIFRAAPLFDCVHLGSCFSQPHWAVM